LYEDDTEVVRMLLIAGINLKCHREPVIFGCPLAIASSQGYEDVLQLLLPLNAGMDFNDHRGSALQAASHAGRKQIAQLLLQTGADVNQEEGRYGSVLQAAIRYEKHIEVVRLLITAGALCHMMWASTEKLSTGR
jgi:ankyrin repeat protein